MVVTLVLGTSALGRAGSSPAFGTSTLLVKWTSRNATNVKLQFRLLQRVPIKTPIAPTVVFETTDIKQSDGYIVEVQFLQWAR
jgi:hypothetical protein